MFKYFQTSAIELLSIPLTVLIILIAYQIADTLNILIPALNQSGSLLDNINNNIEQINDALAASSSLAQLVTLLFWAAVGALVYMIVWAIGAMVADAKNQISMSSSYHHPDSFRNSSYWLSLVTRRLFAFSSFVVLVVYGVILMQIFLPALIGFITDNYQLDVESLLNLVGGMVVLVLSIHILVILIRFMLLRPRIFSSY